MKKRSRTVAILSHCNQCDGIKKNNILFEKAIKRTVYSLSEEYLEDSADAAKDVGISEAEYISGWVDWYIDAKYQVLQCRACGNVSFRVVENGKAGNSPWSDSGDDESTRRRRGSYVQKESFPTPRRFVPDEISRYGSPLYRATPYLYRRQIGGLCDQVYQAIDHGLFAVASMGFRTIVDLYMSNYIGPRGKFEQRLEKMRDQGHVSTKTYDRLRILIDVGNAAAHRGFSPTLDEVVVMRDVVERLLIDDFAQDAGTIFESPDTILRDLKTRIPPRPQKTEILESTDEAGNVVQFRHPARNDQSDDE